MAKSTVGGIISELLSTINGIETGIISLGQEQRLIRMVNVLLERENVEWRIDSKTGIQQLKTALRLIEAIDNKYEEIEINTEEDEVVSSKPEPDLSAKVDVGVIKALVADYEENLAKLGEEAGLEETAKRFHLKPQDIRELIRTKIEIQRRIEAELEAKGKIKVDEIKAVASELAKNEMVLEAKLPEESVDKVREILVEAVSDNDVEILRKTEEEVREVLKTAKARIEVINEVAAEAKMVVAAAKVEGEIETRAREIVEKIKSTGGVIKTGDEVIVRQTIRELYFDDLQTAPGMVKKLKDAGIDGVERVEVEIKAVVEKVQMGVAVPESIGRVYSAAKEGDEIVAAYVEKNSNIVQTLPGELKQYIVAYRNFQTEAPNVPIDQSIVTARLNEHAPSLKVSTVEVGIGQVRAFAKIMYSDRRVVGAMNEAQKRLEKSGITVPTQISNRVMAVRTYYNQQIVNILNNNPDLARATVLFQRMAAIRATAAVFAVRGAGMAAANAGVRYVGDRTINRFTELTVKLMDRYGTDGGLLVAMGAVMSSVATKMAEKSAQKVVLTAASKSLMWLGGLGGPVGWIAAAAIMAGEWVLGKVTGLVNKINEKMGGGWSKGVQNAITNTVGKVPVLGGPVKEVANFAIGVGEGIVNLFVRIVEGLSFAVIGVIIVGIMIFVFVFQMFTGGMVSSLVPPVGMGGGQTTYNDENTPDGWQNTPIPLPDWEGGPIAEGCPQGIPVDGGYLTQGPSAPGCSHEGMSSPAIDIGVAGGTPIRAINDGLATSHYDSKGYGFYVTIEAKCNNTVYKTIYAHMIGRSFPEGSKKQVKKGDIIGYVDNSGNSTGNHLHLEGSRLSVGEFLKGLGFDYNKASQVYKCCTANAKKCPSL